MDKTIWECALYMYVGVTICKFLYLYLYLSSGLSPVRINYVFLNRECVFLPLAV